ncbi:MAG: hypothetical protein WCP11_02490 [Candidatus Saccharibacteria bacterium]
MEHKYKIIYDIKKDMWNWRGALEDYLTDDWSLDNIQRYGSERDKEITNQILGLKKPEAEKILRPYLLSLKNDPSSQLNTFIKIAEKDFRDKYVDACRALERITKHPMISNEFTFYVTTFPRMTVNFDQRIIFMYDLTEGVWGMPIDGFLHEALHFQFYYYWRLDKKSPVYKLSEDEFYYLKESLTVILDEELKPIITLPDCSYPSMKPFRDILHDHWREHHDFDKLVDFGLGGLGNYLVIN